MKFLTILFLKSLLLSNSLMAETLPIKSKFLKQSSECFKNFQSQVCIEIVSKIEKLQLSSFDQNKFKCQTSLLGFQSELIKTYFLSKSSNEKISFMIPYVNKNC